LVRLVLLREARMKLLLAAGLALVASVATGLKSSFDIVAPSVSEAALLLIWGTALLLAARTVRGSAARERVTPEPASVNSSSVEFGGPIWRRTAAHATSRSKS
jgi:hypothetical protein